MYLFIVGLLWRCYLLGFRGKILQKILATLSPPLNGGIFGASVPYTAVRWPARFVSIPGEPGRYAFRDRTRKRFYKRSVRSGIRTRYFHDVKYEGIICWAIGVKDRSITQPRVILVTLFEESERLKCTRLSFEVGVGRSRLLYQYDFVWLAWPITPTTTEWPKENQPSKVIFV